MVETQKMQNISNEAFLYLSGMNIPEYSNFSEFINKKTIKKESKARGFHKKQRWNKSLLAGEKCCFNSIIKELEGMIVLKSEVKQTANSTVYYDPKLDIAIVFDEKSEMNLARRKCRNNVKIKIVKNKEVSFNKTLHDFVSCGGYKVLLVATQNIAKDEEIFVSAADFVRYNNEKNSCICTKEEYCLYTSKDAR